MHHFRLFFLLLVLITGTAFGEAFKKGDTVELTQDTALMFNNTAFKQGKTGERFTVLLHRTDTSKVYLAFKDAMGNDIAVAVPDHTVAIAKAVEAAPAKEIRAISAEEATFLILTDIGSGSGFLAKMDGQVYLITNYHVIGGAKKIRCQSLKEDFEITDGAIDVADELDLVRIPLSRGYAAEVGATPETDSPVIAFGNSGGQKVVTKLSGQLLGTGPQEVEVSCEFISGNSGGPIADKKGRPFAISTYVAQGKGVPSWVKKGTRFEGTRRFGVRLTDKIVWTGTTIPLFKMESQLVYKLEARFKDFLHIAHAIAASQFTKTLEADKDRDREIARIVDLYNRGCQEYRQNVGRTVTVAQLDDINNLFRARSRGLLNDLVRALNTSASEGAYGTRRLTLPRTRNLNTKALSEMTELATYLEKNGKDITPDSLFHFKKK